MPSQTVSQWKINEAAEKIAPDISNIVYCVEESDFSKFLEEALASARTPRFDAAVLTTGVIFPGLIALEQVRDNPGQVNTISVILLTVLTFAVGTVVGRWLRPSPSKKEILLFAQQTQKRGSCSDFVAQSRLIANAVAPPDHSDRKAERHSYCVVDHDAIMRIDEALRQRLATSPLEKTLSIVVTSAAGRREFFNVAECGDCHSEVKLSEISETCEVCLSPFCRVCLTQHLQEHPDKQTRFRCTACNVKDSK